MSGATRRSRRPGAILRDAARFPDTLEYDPAANRLHVGEGFIDNVSPAVWAYTVSGKQVLRQWFSYRKKDRERPIIGDRRQPSPLGDIQPEGWLAEYTEDLINLLNVLDRICAGPLIDAAAVADARAPAQPHQKVEGKKRQKVKIVTQGELI